MFHAVANLVQLAIPLIVAYSGWVAWRKAEREDNPSHKAAAWIMWVLAAVVLVVTLRRIGLIGQQ